MRTDTEVDHPTRRRVAPLAPDDRRAALIEATLPLLRTHGLAVSTRQIAEAAGVAEGTIFRVFPDKNSLVVAAILAATDSGQDVAAMAALDPSIGAREHITQVAQLMIRRLRDNMRLHVLAREMVMNPATTRDIGAALHERRSHIVDTLTEVLTADAASLRVAPRIAAHLLLSVVATSAHMFGGADAPGADEIVSVLLDGLLNGRPPTTGESPC